jgi:hypothetical protein
VCRLGSEALSRDGSRFNLCGFKVVGEGAKGLDSLFSSYYHLMWQDSPVSRLSLCFTQRGEV